MLLIVVCLVFVCAFARCVFAGDTLAAFMAEQEQKFVELLNAEREKRGLQPLAKNTMMTKEELQKILDNHKQWLLDGTGEKADLSEADLSEAALAGQTLAMQTFAGQTLAGQAFARQTGIFHPDSP